MDSDATKGDIEYVGEAESILLRPAMYTLNGTFAEAIAYLDGMYGRYSMHDVWLETKGYVVSKTTREWREFRDWLNAKQGNFHETFRRIQTEYGNGSDACTVVLNLMQEWRMTG